MDGRLGRTWRLLLAVAVAVLALGLLGIGARCWLGPDDSREIVGGAGYAPPQIMNASVNEETNELKQTDVANY